MNCSFRSLLLLSALAATPAGAAAQDGKYKTYKDAYAAGAKAIRAGDLAAAREPLEAAAKLAATDAEKIEAHRALLIPYRELPDVEPMQRAAEFIITTSTEPAERSRVRSAVLSFVQKRGKMDAAVAGYEARLTKDPDDRTALYLLAEAYATHKNDPAKAADRRGRVWRRPRRRRGGRRTRPSWPGWPPSSSRPRSRRRGPSCSRGSPRPTRRRRRGT